MKKIVTLLSIVLLSFPLFSQINKDVKTVAKRMEGAFTSEAQSLADSAYFNISLKMTRIWKSDKNNIWLYVEQAMATRLDKPYRQRIYRVNFGTDGSVISTVFTLPDPEKFIGAAANSTLFSDLKPDALTEREGCAVVLTKSENGNWTGSTIGTGCGSDLRGATYATSKVSVFANRIESWDQGFDANGTQVWGAVNGPYLFIKK